MSRGKNCNRILRAIIGDQWPTMHDPNWQSVQENLDSTNFTNNLIFHQFNIKKLLTLYKTKIYTCKQWWLWGFVGIFNFFLLFYHIWKIQYHHEYCMCTIIEMQSYNQMQILVINEEFEMIDISNLKFGVVTQHFLGCWMMFGFWLRFFSCVGIGFSWKAWTAALGKASLSPMNDGTARYL